MNDDAQLVDQSLSGDSVAYGRLVERYQDRLYSSIYRLLGRAEDARDIVQDAFLQAFLKLDTFRGHSAFYTWLYRIAFNLAVSQMRRHRPVSSIDAAKEGQGIEPLDREGGPEASALDQERAERVHQAVQTLGEEYRQVIVLRELEGITYEEIAELLHIPVGTVRSRLFRARMQLRDRLAEFIGAQVEEEAT